MSAALSAVLGWLLEFAMGWKEEAFEAYRVGWQYVEILRTSKRVDAEAWINDLLETMLRLKEAVHADEEKWGLRQLIVLNMLVTELKLEEGL